jgi:hypothetical protein
LLKCLLQPIDIFGENGCVLLFFSSQLAAIFNELKEGLFNAYIFCLVGFNLWQGTENISKFQNTIAMCFILLFAFIKLTSQ